MTEHLRFRQPCCSVAWCISSHFICTFPATSQSDILPETCCFCFLRPRSRTVWPYLSSLSDFLKVVRGLESCTCSGGGCMQQQWWLVPSSEELLNAHCKLFQGICLLESSHCYSPEDTGIKLGTNMSNNQACTTFRIFSLRWSFSPVASIGCVLSCVFVFSTLPWIVLIYSS